MRHIFIVHFLIGACSVAVLGCNASHVGSECGATGCAEAETCCLTCGGYACVPEGTRCGCPDEDAGAGSCGGPSRIACDPESFCNATTCGGFGECEARPSSCGRIYDPVCGCDGSTYSSRCEAQMADVAVASAGECAQPCSARGESPCAPGTYCRLESMCGADDSGGTCEPIPMACDGDFSPVCGCDGRTYGNACEAAAAAMSVAAPVPCPVVTDCDAQDVRVTSEGCDESGVYWNGIGCTILSGCCEGADCGNGYPSMVACRDARPACDRACGGWVASTCFPDEFCDFATEGCDWADSSGICRPRPTECLEPGGIPVCGCDFSDYLGECSAHLAGTDVGSVGGCVVPG